MKANTRYLSLALEVRRITDLLIRLTETGQTDEELPASLPKVLASLDESTERTTVQRLRASGSFGIYENQRTVNEVFGHPEAKRELVEQIQRVLNAESTEMQKQGALAAIPMLDALERKALFRYNHPQVSLRRFATR